MDSGRWSGDTMVPADGVQNQTAITAALTVAEPVVPRHDTVDVLRDVHCLRMKNVPPSPIRLTSEVVEDNPIENALTTKNVGAHDNILGDQLMVITTSGTTADVRARLA